MNLYDQIKEDIKVAMKGKDMKTLEILRTLSASIKNKAIDTKEELDDMAVMSVIKSDVKKLQDALTTFIDAAREDLVEKTKEEIGILKKYLPAEMSDEDLGKAVKEALEKESITEMSQMGDAMRVSMGAVQGKADGKRVKAVVEEILKG